MVDEINKKITDTNAIQYIKQVQNGDNKTKSDTELQKFAAQMLANLYDNCADVLDEYNKNRGIADVGTYLEGARKIIDWASFGNIKSTSHIKDTLREKANELKNINTNDSEAFKKRFKELSGVEYNEENIRNFMDLVNKDVVNTESDDFKEACYKAFGLKGTEKQQKYIKRSSFVDGIGDIVLMLVTLGAVSKTKMMGKLTSKLYKSLEHGASKFLKAAKSEKVAKLGTSIIMGGATLAGFTLSKETLDNLSNPTRDAKSFSTWKQTLIGSLESFGFGAFGGLLNESVVGPLVKYIAKPSKQVSRAVSRALSDKAELSGIEMMQTAIKTQNLNISGLFKMKPAELKDFSKILGAHATGFGVEVVGFAGYEAGLDAIKDICDPQTGRLPDDMTLANLTKYLGHKIGDQFSNLGTIKGVSQLLMMSKGGKAAQNAMMNKMIADSQKLNDVKFKKVNENGSESIEMTLPDGSKKLFSSPEQAIQTCQTLMQMEFIVNNLKQQEEGFKPEGKNTEESKPEQISVDKPEIKTDDSESKIEPESTKPVKDESVSANEPEVNPINEKVKEPENTEIKCSPNQKLSIEKASDSDLRVIHQIDLEAFEGRYRIDSDFEAYKADLESQKTSTYAIKGVDGNIIGYYQLEPVENGELYIHSIGVKKELRNSKTSYRALKQAQVTITELAKQQNIDKVVLDVDAEKPELVKLYKKFGFEVTGENSGSEAGQSYHDYRMEADVKKILANDKSLSEPQKAETKQEEKINSVQQTEKKELFFAPPKIKEELTEIYTHQDARDWYRYRVKITQKDGKEFINFDGTEFEFHPATIEGISDIANAYNLYQKANFASPNIQLIRIGDRFGYIKASSKVSAHNFLEKLDQEYDINIYYDAFDFNGKNISFNKNGRNVKVQIVSDNEQKPPIVESDTLYVSETEMFDVLDRLVNIPGMEFGGSGVYSGLNTQSRPNQEAITSKNLKIQSQIKELHSILKEKLYSDTPQYQMDEQITKVIRQKAQERENAGWDTKYSDESFDSYLAQEFTAKNSSDYSANNEFVQKYVFESDLRRCPELKPYLADIYRHGYITKENYIRYTDFFRSGKGDAETIERAACIAALVKTHGYREEKQFTELYKIPTKYLAKTIFVEKVENINDILAKYDQDVKFVSERMGLKRQFNLGDDVADDISKACMDEYGRVNTDKMRMAQTLCSMAPDFYKHYSSYGSNGPFTMVSDLIRLCKTGDECFKVVSEIIPKLLSESNSVSPTMGEIKKMLHSDNPELAMEIIDFCRVVREKDLRYESGNYDTYAYNSLLEGINSREILKLYKDLYDYGFNLSLINNIIRNAKNNDTTVTINNEVIDFCKALKPLCEEKKLNIYQIIDKFSEGYSQLCKTGNYEGKVRLIENIEQLSDLVHNPMRSEQPLSLEHAIELAKNENCSKIKDLLFLKDSKGFYIDVEQDSAFNKLISLAKDNVVYERFFKDYLPLAKQMPVSAFRYPTYIEKMLKLPKEEYERVLPHLQYLVEIRPDFCDNHIFDLAMLDNEKFEKLNADYLKNKDFSSYEILEFGQLDYWDYFNLKFNVLPLSKRLFYNNSYQSYDRLALLTQKYSKLSRNELETICETVEYFNENIKKMQHQDMEVRHKDITELINQKHESVLQIVDLVGQTGMNHALGMKYKGLKQLLENASSLSKLDTETKTFLREQLAILPHPEQKLEKLSVISGLIEHVEKEPLSEVIKGIKSPEMTMKQQELADSIFADSTKNYGTQIEDFIVKFNVPVVKREHIRKFLRKENLQQKYVTPPPVEKQLEIIDKKINAVNSNDKIPQNKKDAYLDVLKKQKQDLLANPDKYTRRRLNENVMKLLSKQVESHINLVNNNRAFNKLVNEKIYKILGIDVTESLLNADITYDSKYFPKLFEGISNNDFKKEFTKLIELVKANPGSSFTQMLDTLSTNLETRRLFEENGLNYDRWIKFDENFRQEFTVVIDVEKAVQKAKDNLVQEFKSELAQKLAPAEIAKLTQILDDMHLDHAGQKDLPKIIKAIEILVENDEYWKQNNADIKTFKDHIAIHKKNIHDVEQLKDSTEELYVRLWDKNDVGRNLFFGNHVGCCTSIGKFNSYAAPQHLMNSFVNGIEIVDKAGNSMGNSMCYFAKVDGRLTFVIDSFEASGKLGSAPEVTDALISYAKRVCTEMGQPGANIMFGPNYNKVNFDRCIKTDNHTIEVIGRAPASTYIDCTGGTSNINVAASNRSMHEIIDL